jgi:hypothetical protein
MNRRVPSVRLGHELGVLTMKSKELDLVYESRRGSRTACPIAVNSCFILSGGFRMEVDKTACHFLSLRVKRRRTSAPGTIFAGVDPLNAPGNFIVLSFFNSDQTWFRGCQ